MVSTEKNLPPYEPPPAWIPVEQRFGHPEYASDVRHFLPRTVTLQREKGKPLGFNVRGGLENKCGIFISGVMPNSVAEMLGLKEGDQILFANDVDFGSIDHTEAVEVLKKSQQLRLQVRFFPYAYARSNERIERNSSKENNS